MPHLVEALLRRRFDEVSGELVKLGFGHREGMVPMTIARVQPRQAKRIGHVDDVKLVIGVSLVEDAAR
jgi:hypothetical protein